MRHTRLAQTAIALALGVGSSSFAVAGANGLGNAAEKIGGDRQQHAQPAGTDHARTLLQTKQCEQIGKIRLQEATITSAQLIAESVSLPAHCEVKIFVRPTGYSTSPESGIGIELWLPVQAAWNGKLQVVGNGGYSPRISYSSMAALLQHGYAAAGTDTGHSGESMLFVVDHPERVAYWGHLAIHETAKKSKAIIAEFYREPARYSYFSGCSTGGHQALMAAQRYPDDFDGIIAGAPGNNRTALNAAFLWQFIQNHAPGDDTAQIIPREKLPLITQASVADCDDVDGLTDGIVDDPRQCNFDPAVLQCPAGDGPDCLTATQVDALSKMYQGARNPRTGEQIYPGFPVGSEGVDGRGWAPYWADPSDPNRPARVDFWRYWVFEDPNWNWWSFDWDHHFTFAKQKMGPVIDAINPDLRAFEERGGKLIMYHGWADPVVSGVDTANYYEDVVGVIGSRERTEKFARLFMAPGMAHCGGGPGPNSFDAQAALEQWVEAGDAPSQIIATRSEGGHTVMSRPLCPYPQVARYRGHGSVNEASNFECRDPD